MLKLSKLQISLSLIGIIILASAGIIYKNNQEPVKNNQEPVLSGSLIYPQYGGTGTSSKPTYGKMLVGNANGNYDVVATSTLGLGGGTGTGTVTSVAMTVPTGLTISGSPITTSGTLGLTMTDGYVIATTTRANT